MPNRAKVRWSDVEFETLGELLSFFGTWWAALFWLVLIIVLAAIVAAVIASPLWLATVILGHHEFAAGVTAVVFLLVLPKVWEEFDR